MKKRFLTLMLAFLAIATTAGAQTKYDIWVGGVQVTSANASNITGGDIKSGTVTFKQSTNGVSTLTLTNVKIERSGSGKQGIRTGFAGLIINFEGTNTITTDNSCALRCDAETWLLTSRNSKTTLTEKIQEAIYVTGGNTLHFRGTGSGEIFVNSTSEYAIEGEKGTERVRFFSAPIVTLNGAKGSLVKLGNVIFTEETYPGISVTLKATNDTSYPQVQNVAAWNEYGYNHIAAPAYKATHPAYNSSSKTILAPNGLSGNLTSYDIVINDDVVQLNSTHFPDANFLAEVKKLYPNNTNGFPNRGFYSKAMANAQIYFDVSNKNISNLKGVEHFTALTRLDCYNNQLTSLDVSKNTALTRLDCSNNQLTSLDVSKNTALTRLDCYNNQLTSLDVSKNTALTDLRCSNNQLTSLDVSKNTALTRLDCSNNQLTSFDVSKNTALTRLDCSNNQLTSLDVSKNTALQYLLCYSNQLTSLDVSKNTALTGLECYNNKIKGDEMLALVNSLPTVTSKFSFFYVIDTKNSNEENVITKSQVAIAKSKGWNVWDYNDGSIVTYAGSEDGIVINSTNFPDANFRNYLLEQSYGKDAILTNAEISAVTSIDVDGKSIANLKGIEFFTALTYLRGGNNKLTSLDVSKNTKLTGVRCHNNQLTSLNVSKNTALTILDCSGNKIKGDEMQALVNSLPTVTTSGYFYVIDTKDRNEENVITKQQVAIAKGKKWKVYDYNDGSLVTYAGSDETTGVGTLLNDNGEMTNDRWYTIDGKKLSGEPTKKGVYIYKGKKVVK